MNDIYAINAGKIKELERKNKELEYKIKRLSIMLVTAQFKNKKLEKIIEKSASSNKEKSL